MFDNAPFADLTADQLCEEIGATQARLREQEWRELALAAAWGDMHCPESRPPITRAEAARRLVHGERIIPAGGDGTPLISEFACAELGLLLGSGYVTGGIAIRDALNLRHRHPHLWALLATGHGRVWKARHVARMCQGADLTLAQTHVVDAATTAFLDKLAWSAFTRLIEAKIIEADPAAAEARRQAAALARFVSTGRCNEHGLKTLIVQANAGDVVTFVALCDRIAAILAHTGDTDTVDVRRSKAIGILANPAAALALLEEHATVDPEPRAPDDDQLDDQPERSSSRTSASGPRGRAARILPSRPLMPLRRTQPRTQLRTLSSSRVSDRLKRPARARTQPRTRPQMRATCQLPRTCAPHAAARASTPTGSAPEPSSTSGSPTRPSATPGARRSRPSTTASAP